VSSWRDHRILGLTRGEATWLIIGIAALAYEMWAVATREGDVLTRAYRANCPRWAFWPVGIGVLMGHLHGPAIPGIGSGAGGRWSLAALIVVGVGILARDLFLRTRYPAEWVLPLFVLGVILGASIWVGRP
jgi:hypothetical protein